MQVIKTEHKEKESWQTVFFSYFKFIELYSTMENNNQNSRRSFLRNAAKGAVVAAVTPTAFAMAEPVANPASIHANILGANDRIRVAVLGLNGRGKTHVEGIMALATKTNV